MANRYATKTGNWSDVTVWDGGTTLPGSGDTVRPNTFTVTIDQNITVTELRNDASAPAAAGGGFTLNAGFTINANITGNAAVCVTFSSNSPNAGTINGNIVGSTNTATAYGVNNTGTGTVNIVGNITGGAGNSGGNNVNAVNNASTGTVNVTGVVTGGSTNNTSRGISNSSTGTINVTGNVNGGSASGCEGIFNSSSGVVSIVGNLTGGSSSSAYGLTNNSAGQVTVTGNAIGGIAAHGISNSSTGIVTITGDLIPSGSASGAINGNGGGRITVFGNIQSHSTGHSGYGLGILTIDPSITQYHAYRVQSGGSIGAERKLWTGGTNLGQPVQADVRYGTVYGASGEYFGGLHVPANQYVSQGVLVDATVGTLMASSPDLLISTTIATLPSQTSFTLTAGSSDDNAYKNARVIVTNAAGTKKCFGICSGYTGISKTVTLLADPGIFTMAVGDSISIVANNVNTVQINGQLQTAGVDVAAKVNTNLDTTVSSRLASSSYTAPDNATISAIAGYVDTEVAAIKAKTDNLPASPAAVGSAMTLTSAYDFAKGTVAMTESYNADGSAPTPAQALFVIMQVLTELEFSGTTGTVKKLDGSTTALTLTVNDPTTPTSITRAT